MNPYIADARLSISKAEQALEESKDQSHGDFYRTLWTQRAIAYAGIAQASATLAMMENQPLHGGGN